MTDPSVVFVGVGAIGLPMLARLRTAAGEITAVDPAPNARQRAGDIGVRGVPHLSEAGPGEYVIVMLASPAQLEELVTDALEGELTGQRWVVMSTVGPDSLREQGARLEAAGAIVIDAPVTGGVTRARTGELTLFAAGSPSDIDAARPLLECFGAVHEAGDAIGDGQAIKMVNQHLCSVHIVAAAEALSLAENLGLDQDKVLSLVSGGAAGSWMLSDRGPRMVQDNDVEVTSSINIFVKDSNLASGTARSVNAETPLLDLAKARYEQAAESGLSTYDDSRVIETYPTVSQSAPRSMRRERT